MKRFIVEFEGEEDYAEPARERQFSDLNILCMIPVPDLGSARANATSLISKGVVPNHIMIVKYSKRDGSGKYNKYATAVRWEDLSEYKYEEFSRGWWWQIIYMTKIHPSDLEKLEGLGHARYIDHREKFEYFEIIERYTDDVEKYNECVNYISKIMSDIIDLHPRAAAAWLLVDIYARAREVHPTGLDYMPPQGWGANADPEDIRRDIHALMRGLNEAGVCALAKWVEDRPMTPIQ